MGRVGPDGIMGGSGGSEEGQRFRGIRLSGLVAIEELAGSGSRGGMREVEGRDVIH